MFRINSLTLLLLIAAMMQACGEPFKGHLNGGLTDPGDHDLGRNLWGDSITGEDTDPDKNVLYNYREELEDQESRTVRLARKIKAFDVTMSRASDSEVDISARITFSCSKVVDYEKNVNRSDLSSMKVLDLGTEENHNLKLECISRNCNKIVVAVRQRGGNNATVLVGLRADRTVDGELIYKTRSVPYTPYYQTFHSYKKYSEDNNCEADSHSGGNSLTDLLIRVVTDDDLRDKAKDWLDKIF